MRRQEADADAIRQAAERAQLESVGQIHQIQQECSSLQQQVRDVLPVDSLTHLLTCPLTHLPT